MCVVLVGLLLGAAAAQPPPCQSDLDCDDAMACTDTFCRPGDPSADGRGCVTSQSPDDTPCSNGNVCDGEEVCIAGACVIANPTTCAWPGAIFVGFATPTAGTVSYAGGSAALVGTNIEADTVTGIATPANAGVTGTCIGCRLSFQTGALTGSTANEWTFSSGGLIRINGAIDYNGDTVIGPGDIANTLLVDGGFSGPATLRRTGPSSYQLTADVLDEKRAPLRNFYGIPSPVFSGYIQLTIITTAQPPAGFSAATVQDGYLSNVAPGCENTRPALPGTPCDLDANLCTADTCNGLGTCVGGPLTTCADDGSLCNGPEFCDGQTGTCRSGPAAPATTPCEVDNNRCTVDRCNGSGACSTTSTVVCTDDNNFCNGAESCDPNTGVCVSGPLSPPGMPCDVDGNLCTTDVCDGVGVCRFDVNNPPGSPCSDGIFCNGTDTCDGAGQCAVHSGDPCSGTQCNTCQELLLTCYDPAQTPCDPGSGFQVGQCDGSGTCVDVNYVRDYAILRSPLAGPPDVVTYLRANVNVAGHVCTDYITLRKFGVIDGDAVVPRSGPDDALRFSFDTTVTGGVFTSGGPVKGGSRVLTGRGIDTSGTAVEIQRCLAAMAQAEAKWADFHAMPVSPGMTLGPLRVRARGSLSISVGAGVVVIDSGDVRVRPYGVLTLSGTPATQMVVFRVRGTRGLRLAGRSSIALQGLTPEQVIFVVDRRVWVGPFSTVNGTLFSGDRVFLAGHGTINGQILGPQRITLNPSVHLLHHPFFGW